MKIFLPIFFLFCSINLFSQKIAVTAEGDTLQIFENGTWKKFNSSSQEIITIESSVSAEVEVDEFSGEKSISTEQWSRFASGALSNMSGYAFYNESGIIGFTITFNGDLGCMVKWDSNMMVKLSNGEVVPLIYISDTDCGSYTIGTWMALSKDDLKNPNYKDIIKENNQLLKDFDWLKIRVTGSEVYSDLEPKSSRKVENPEQFFRQHILAIEGKK